MVKVMWIYGIRTKGWGEDVNAGIPYGEDQR